jgi:hypothetical protein
MCPRVFSLSTDYRLPGPGRAVVQKKQAVSPPRLTSTFNSVYEREAEPLRIKNYGLDAFAQAHARVFPLAHPQ